MSTDDDWLDRRIAELRGDGGLQAKIERVRKGVADGTYVGEVTSRADLERMSADLNAEGDR